VEVEVFWVLPAILPVQVVLGVAARVPELLPAVTVQHILEVEVVDR
jgi:hypothetical protein